MLLTAARPANAFTGTNSARRCRSYCRSQANINACLGYWLIRATRCVFQIANRIQHNTRFGLGYFLDF
jgi:hypothetical protein